MHALGYHLAHVHARVQVVRLARHTQRGPALVQQALHRLETAQRLVRRRALQVVDLVVFLCNRRVHVTVDKPGHQHLILLHLHHLHLHVVQLVQHLHVQLTTHLHLLLLATSTTATNPTRTHLLPRIAQLPATLQVAGTEHPAVVHVHLLVVHVPVGRAVVQGEEGVAEDEDKRVLCRPYGFLFLDSLSSTRVSGGVFHTPI